MIFEIQFIWFDLVGRLKRRYSKSVNTKIVAIKLQKKNSAFNVQCSIF